MPCSENSRMAAAMICARMVAFFRARLDWNPFVTVVIYDYRHV